MADGPELISVIIPAHNRGSLIGFQLDALGRQTTARPFEVIVADNGSTDDTVGVAATFADVFERFSIVDASARPGAGPARNIGLAAACGEMIAFCDSDDIVQPDWLEALASAWAPGTMVSGRIVLLTDSADSAAAEATVQVRGLASTRPASSVPSLVSTANMAIGRADLERVGRFDESFRYAQDLELSWRGQLAGLTLVDAPDAVVLLRRQLKGTKLFRQYYRWGRARPQMYRIYRDDGYERRSPREFVDEWVRMAYHGVRAPFDPLQRSYALRQAGMYVGYLAGSVRYRVLYL